MITFIFILITAGIAAKSDARTTRLRSNDKYFAAYIASLCIAVVTYYPITNPFIDFVLYFGTYAMTYDIAFVMFKNKLKRRHT
jgi:hypothetical protein